MNNPYVVLGLEKNQNANKNEIRKANMLAMSARKYTLPEIATAMRQLLDPSKRLAADFMFPSRIKSRRLQKIVVNMTVKEIDLDSVNSNSFDSL